MAYVDQELLEPSSLGLGVKYYFIATFLPQLVGCLSRRRKQQACKEFLAHQLLRNNVRRFLKVRTILDLLFQRI